MIPGIGQEQMPPIDYKDFTKEVYTEVINVIVQ